jgi:ribosome biogenesis GTPase
MQGQITKIISDLYTVNSNNNFYNCKCRGIFRKEHITPLVGDYVLFDDKELIINKILPRKNEFNRPKVANIDRAIIVTSLVEPDLDLNLLDKLLVLMELKKVEPVICLSKVDLVNTNNYQDIINYYQKYYQVVRNRDKDKLKELFKDKTCVIIGQTGAGKSSLLNYLDKDLNLEVGEISLALGRGKHTTRVVELFNLYQGKIMDTPGFSSLEITNYSKEEIREAFPEFKLYPCPYKDCSHTNEENCNIKEAVKNKLILASRYNDYLYLISKVGDKYEN